MGGVAELARSDAVNFFRKLQPRDRERRPQRLVLLILVSLSHTQAVFGVIAIVFNVTHRLGTPLRTLLLQQPATAGMLRG